MTPHADELGRAELGRAELGRAGLGRAGLGRAELGRAELALARLALRLGASEVAGWSAAERRLAAAAGKRDDATTAAGTTAAGTTAAGTTAAGTTASAIRALIRAGGDPLGEEFCRLRPAAARRAAGQTFTPQAVVEAMVAWASLQVDPARVVDPGTGSARFLVAAGRRWPGAALVGAETDPLAAAIGRATLAAAGLAGRAEIVLGDYRSLRLPPAAGPTLFLGNPPYVRHHRIGPAGKAWLSSAAAGQGMRASKLAGLHVHFFLATALHAVPGDVGALLTSAEWLDVNYGALVRSLLLGPLGGLAIHLLDPARGVFPDAAVTSVITCFRPGAQPAGIRLRRVPRAADLSDLTGGTPVPAADLRAASRWSQLMAGPAGPPRRPPAGYVELGELCRVHRGQVTGANRVWITGADGTGVPPRYRFPAVTRASELFLAADVLTSTSRLRCVIDLPADLAELSGAELDQVAVFLARARAAGAAGSYVARHRQPWWRVRLAEPAPILASYMARRPPAFVRNLVGARHVNIAHGLYPRQVLPDGSLDSLASYLRRAVRLADGRVYAGGLTKFEPGEMARLPVPGPELLAGDASRTGAG